MNLGKSPDDRTEVGGGRRSGRADLGWLGTREGQDRMAVDWRECQHLSVRPFADELTITHRPVGIDEHWRIDAVLLGQNVLELFFGDQIAPSQCPRICRRVFCLLYTSPSPRDS